ncbi:MBG domain-containing protein, partial [Singulisphaera rosea]
MDVSLAGIHAGSYADDIQATFAGDSSFAGSQGSASLTVTPAALMITANNATKVYGAALPTLSASYSGFVNGDTSSSLTTPPTLGTTASARSHVGNYPITASGAVDPDYTITYVAGVLSVTTASLTITANDASKVYGAPLPAFSASYNGFVNGDTSSSLTTPPSLTTTATASSHVGTYPITAAGAVDPDYTISYVSGVLSVTPASLTVTANDATKVYGAALPALSVSYGGFVNGDTPSSLTTPPTVSTTATSSSHVGTYPVTASGAVDPDYSITYVAGTL